MRLIYGTGNRAKLQSMQETLSPLPLEIVGIDSVLGTVPAIDETGSDPLENAVLKATACYDVLRAPVFSCDSGLFIEGLEDRMQPGVHVRMVGGKYLNDDEMLEHYSSIANMCGGFCRAMYRNAICLVYDERHIYKYTGNDISGEAFLLSSTPHPRRREGFPLDSLSIHIGSGKYYYDLEEKRLSDTASGFLHFFRDVLQDLNRP